MPVSTQELHDARIKWDVRWLHRCVEVSTWSKDPAAKVGCVIVDEDEKVEIAAGYNGFPRNIVDDERLNQVETKLQMVVHAEANAICSAAKRGVSLAGCTAYVNKPPCSNCAGLLIQCGIARVVHFANPDLDTSKWKKSIMLGRSMFNEAGVRHHEFKF